ncbi:MAG TPA: zinc ribbon domain-containing protein, partial [Pyrinomonadaceae bacterium]|nr:zinc ribbon domain-containing protein [Pyrinomonadaceae bacterium]
MFCPSCGSEERQASQYCRACGTDLRGVRIGLERPDSITQSAISAREEVGRAVADKIREMEDVRYLHQFARKVLPQVEKFLESPEEKRLRRLRSGTVMSLIGFMTGFASFFVLVNSRKDEIEFIFGCLLALSLLILGAGLA